MPGWSAVCVREHEIVELRSELAIATWTLSHVPELRSVLAIAVRERDQLNETLRAWLTGDLYVRQAQYVRGILGHETVCHN